MSERELKVIGRVGKCVTEGCKNFGRLGKVNKKKRVCGMCGYKLEVYVLVEPKEKVRIWTVQFVVGGE